MSHTPMFWLIRALLVTINNQSIKILIIHTQMFWLIRALLVTINNQSIKILIIHTEMFRLIRALLVTINNQPRSWSSIHRCSDWSGPYLSLSTIKSRSWSSIHRFSVWSGPYLSLSTINQDLYHPYTDVLINQGLTCHYQQSMKILIIHTQMFRLIRALLVTINNQSRSWWAIHGCSDWSGPYLSLSTINQDLDHPYTDVQTDQGLTCHYQQSINQDLDHPYIDILSDQGLTCHYQQSIKILIIHTQMFRLIRALLVSINNQIKILIIHTQIFCLIRALLVTINNQSIKILIIHTQMFWLIRALLVTINNQSIKILIIHTEMFRLIRALLVTINNQPRSWSSIHRCSDWSKPYLSLSTINQDHDHSYTDVQTDQGLTCHYQQSTKILIIHTQMFRLIRALLVSINNQIKILIIHTQIFCLIRALLVTINNQSRSLSSIHRCSD